VLLGAAIVVVSTLFISWREHQLSRRGRPPSAPGESAGSDDFT
jgi:hypothetical protein